MGVDRVVADVSAFSGCVLCGEGSVWSWKFWKLRHMTFSDAVPGYEDYPVPVHEKCLEEKGIPKHLHPEDADDSTIDWDEW